MIFHMYSAIGRTGSFRLRALLSKNYTQHVMGSKETMVDPNEEHYIHYTHSIHIPMVEGAIPLLSTRACKKDAALSKILSGRWNAWHKNDPYPDIQEPIIAPEDKYTDLVYHMIKGEQAYIKMYDPVIIYVEDSIELIEAKISKRIGKPFKCPHPEEDRKFISEFPVKEWILNYDEIPEYRPATLPKTVEKIPGFR